jgi:hypothetical protein
MADERTYEQRKMNFRPSTLTLARCNAMLSIKLSTFSLPFLMEEVFQKLCPTTRKWFRIPCLGPGSDGSCDISVEHNSEEHQSSSWSTGFHQHPLLQIEKGQKRERKKHSKNFKSSMYASFNLIDNFFCDHWWSETVSGYKSSMN